MAFVTCTWSSSSEDELDWLFHTRDRPPAWDIVYIPSWECLSTSRPHDKVALEDREGRRFEDKGSCQHVPWQAIDQKITPYPSKNEEPQNVYWKIPASCLLEKCTRRKDREQSSGLDSVSVCWILLLGALANGMFLHSHN